VRCGASTDKAPVFPLFPADCVKGFKPRDTVTAFFHIEDRTTSYEFTPRQTEDRLSAETERKQKYEKGGRVSDDAKMEERRGDTAHDK
jgi:hypothetical protein